MPLAPGDHDLISGIANRMAQPAPPSLPPAPRADLPDYDRRLDAMIEALRGRGVEGPLVSASRMSVSRRWLVTVVAGTFPPGAFKAERLDDALALAEAHVAALPPGPPARFAASVRREIA
jgi:hypothetical protein